MIRTLLLIALVFALQNTPAPFTAVWVRPGVARLEWTQPPNVVEMCLIRKPINEAGILIGCWYNLPAGETGLTLWDKGPVSGIYQPRANDAFIWAFDGVESGAAQLHGFVFLPVMRH